MLAAEGFERGEKSTVISQGLRLSVRSVEQIRCPADVTLTTDPTLGRCVHKIRFPCGFASGAWAPSSSGSRSHRPRRAGPELVLRWLNRSSRGRAFWGETSSVG